jgi:transcriptional regulator with XRE-family HTH domain
LGRRLKQTELKARWEVSQGSVSQWLAGKAMPEDRDIIKRIAKDCGVDPGWLDWGTTYDPGQSVGGEDEGGARKRS